MGLAVPPWGHIELAGECSSEAGGVFVTDRAGYLLDAHVAAHQEIGRSLQSSFVQQVAEPKPGVLFE